MSKKQTRRSVSIRGATYETVRAYCESSGVSMSEFVEERIAGFFGQRPAAPVLRPAPHRAVALQDQTPRSRSAPKLDSSQLHDAARCFTF